MSGLVWFYVGSTVGAIVGFLLSTVLHNLKENGEPWR